MHLLKVSALSLLAGSAGARYVETQEPDGLVLYPDDSARFLIEYGPGKRRWVSEDDKWEMRRNGQSFMDVTDHQDFGTGLQAEQAKNPAVFPTKPAHKDQVLSLFSSLDKARMMADLDKFTSFYTRYYKSATGKQSSDWILERVSQIIAESEGRASTGKTHGGAVTAAPFPHAWAQSSLIATIPGRTNRTIVIGAHQDSQNQWFPVLRAPGADDDGSGTVTILEVFRVLMASAADGAGSDLVEGRALNTVEFHWYSAEEAGLLGSADVFHRYHADRRDVRAMLQQDMTGYSRGTLDRGGPDVVGVITDFVDPHLTAFVKMVVDEYCEIGWADTKCGYACSDHASASKAGYPSAFVIESVFEDSNQRIHSTDDLAKHLDFDHMLQHARLTLAFAYELAFTDFDQLENDDGRV